MPNLDQVLGGGLLRGSTVMVIGPPGSGKTVLGQQIAFAGARRGEVALYFTGFSETTTSCWPTASRSPSSPRNSSASKCTWRACLTCSSKAPWSQRRRWWRRPDHAEPRSSFSTDSAACGDSWPTITRRPRFIYSLGAKLALLGATLLVLVEGDANDRDRHPEQSVCDVIVSLTRVLHGGDRRRQLQVLEVRGAGPLAGVHSFVIDATGLNVYPRLNRLRRPICHPRVRRAPVSVWRKLTAFSGAE